MKILSRKVKADCELEKVNRFEKAFFSILLFYSKVFKFEYSVNCKQKDLCSKIQCFRR